MGNRIEGIGIQWGDWGLIAMICTVMIASVLMYTVNAPYDMWAVWYLLFLLIVGGLYFFVVYPLSIAYDKSNNAPEGE